MNFKNVEIPNVNGWNGKRITNQNIEVINDTYCFDIHTEQTEKYSHEWPFVATGRLLEG